LRGGGKKRKKKVFTKPAPSRRMRTFASYASRPPRADASRAVAIAVRATAASGS